MGRGNLGLLGTSALFPFFVAAEELPRSLQILDLTGNECSRQDGYRWDTGEGEKRPKKSGRSLGVTSL